MSTENKIVTSEHGYKVFLSPPSQESLNDYYAQLYYQNPQGTYQENYTEEEGVQRKLRIQLLDDFIHSNIEDVGFTKMNFLDVGCGEGFVLSHFKEKGWEITGLDFSTHGVRMKNPGLESFIIQGDVYNSIQELISSGLKFHVVFLGNILEHVLDPVALIDSLNQLLANDGLLCVTVPNDFSELQESLLENGEISNPYWLAFPDHLNYFNLDSLTKLLNSRGLPVIDHYGDFPIEWYLMNSESNYVEDKSKGKSAHTARVILDSMINKTENVKAKQNFWRSLSELGFGRSITTISKKRK